MSTRSTTHFVYAEAPEPTAIVYRHSDGYPSGAGADLLRFFDDVKAQTADTRFGDASYLAAKYVVWLADMFANRYTKLPNGEYGYVKTAQLDFISVGVMRSDPSDIEYRYIVVCGTDDGRGNPRVLVDFLDGSEPRPLADALATA